MNLSTSSKESIKLFIRNLHLPASDSHKGQNGRVLVIGGSKHFHAGSLWSAEIASSFVDIVHYSSTAENNEVFLSLKKRFQNGIIVPHDQLLDYVKEDDVILIGPGMERGNIRPDLRFKTLDFRQILEMKDEGEFTRGLTYYLLKNFPEKKFVIDASALQMMDKEWLLLLKTKPILTPHQKEFEKLFGISVMEKTVEEKGKIVLETSKKYHCVILLKAIVDIISDGTETIFVEGGNAGLTKGGSGDVLSGLTAALHTMNDSLASCVTSSFVVKSTADELFKSKGYWYNSSILIGSIPGVFQKILQTRNL